MEKENLEDRGIAQPEVDRQGYLLDYKAWTHEIGAAVAADLGLEMTEKHWQLVTYARQVYEQTQKTPTRRKLVAEFGVDPQELFVLFPSSPMRKLCKVAGLPKPKNCL